MSVVQHSAIIATTPRFDAVERLTAALAKFGENFTSLVHVVDSGEEVTVFIAPDAANEFSGRSAACNTFRQAAVDHLRSTDEDDVGSGPWAWVEVSFGEAGQMVTRGNNPNSYSNKPFHAGALDYKLEDAH